MSEIVGSLQPSFIACTHAYDSISAKNQVRTKYQILDCYILIQGHHIQWHKHDVIFLIL